jgi:hypothetical protein
MVHAWEGEDFANKVRRFVPRLSLESFCCLDGLTFGLPFAFHRVEERTWHALDRARQEGKKDRQLLGRQVLLKPDAPQRRPEAGEDQASESAQAAAHVCPPSVSPPSYDEIARLIRVRSSFAFHDV